MRKSIIVICLLVCCLFSWGQSTTVVYVKYQTTLIHYPVKIRGFQFATFLPRNSLDEFSIKDSSSIREIDRIFAAILSDTTQTDNYPNVTQQITISRPDGSYDMLFSNGVNAMEINGRAIPFNKNLQNIIDLWIAKQTTTER